MPASPQTNSRRSRLDFTKSLGDAVTAAGYPAKADPAAMNKPMVVLLLTILVIYVTMVYGPIAAALVELFPTRIRYTSMSLPYHIGNGWFGGFLPTTAFALHCAHVPGRPYRFHRGGVAGIVPAVIDTSRPSSPAAGASLVPNR